MRRVAFAVWILAASFLLGEGVLRARAALKEAPPDNPDRSLRREWKWALRHLAAGSATLPGYAEYDPRLGWVTKPNLTTPGSRTNSAGMHSSRDFPLERVPGIPRILFVGDSYTFGAHVDDEDAFTWVLEREYLTGWEVLNLAVSGHGPGQILQTFEARGARYRPDIVVFGFYARGFFRLFDRFRSYAKPYFILNDGGELDLRGVPVISPQDLYAQYTSGARRVPGWSYSYLLGAWRRALRTERNESRIGPDDPRWKLMAAILRRFRDRALEIGADPFLLIIPNRPEQYVGSVYRDLDLLAQEEARTLGLPYLSLAEGFGMSGEQAPDGGLYRDRDVGGHLSVEGNRRTAELLHRSLSRLFAARAEPPHD